MNPSSVRSKTTRRPRGFAGTEAGGVDHRATHAPEHPPSSLTPGLDADRRRSGPRRSRRRIAPHHGAPATAEPTPKIACSAREATHRS
jgi:hypothetical protein